MQDLTVEERASILDLTRRVALLEEGLYGHSLPSVRPALLVRCYREAHGALTHLDDRTAGMWVAQAYLWDARTLIALGRQVNDPYPYRPMLAVLDLCLARGVPGAKEAIRHLEDVSQDVLTAQGLEIVAPRDLMGTLRLSEALNRLAGR